MKRSAMQLGLMWGSGVTRPAIVRFAQRYAFTGGWRGRFGTELLDEARRHGSLRKALRKTPMVWTWRTEGEKVVFGVDHLEFLARCQEAELPVLLTLDPMEPGGPLGTGYHQRPLRAALSFPEYRITEFEEFVVDLLALVRSEFPRLRLSGLQWGNEVEYLPYVRDWRAAYDRYWRALVSLGEILPAFYPGVPVIVGGQSGRRRAQIPVGGGQVEEREGLSWFCGRRGRSRWGDRRAPLALAFHAVVSFKGGEPHRLQIAEVEEAIRAGGRRLRKFGRPVYLTECAGFGHFDRLGLAAAEAGLDGFWAIADHWLQPRWGVDEGGKANTRGLGMWGAEGWPNERTRESFKRLALALR